MSCQNEVSSCIHLMAEFPQVWALNEASLGMARNVFRAWDDRLNFGAPALTSNDDDPELLIHVPFTGSIKLRAICVVGMLLVANSSIAMTACHLLGMAQNALMAVCQSFFI